MDGAIVASGDATLVVRGTGYREDNHGPNVNTAVEVYGETGELLSITEQNTPPAALACAN
jgi:hypothetical protein